MTISLEDDKIVVSIGLSGQDGYFDQLTRLWEQLRLSAYEAASNPEADLISFAQTAEFFGVILDESLNNKPGAYRDDVAEPPRKKRNIEASIIDTIPKHYSAASLPRWKPIDITPIAGEITITGGITNIYTPVVGLIYLTTSPLSLSPPDQLPELNLGVIIDEKLRNKGYARHAVELVVKHAFEKLNAHRIQATLVNGSTKDHMTSILTQMWFGHEGIARKAFYHPLLAEWQDITRFGIIDTHWVMRGYWKPAPKSLWDELFLRQERERADLLRWEEENGKVKRSASMETLRAAPPPDSTMTDSDSEVSGAKSKVHENQANGTARNIEAWNSLVKTAGQKRSRDEYESESDSGSVSTNDPSAGNGSPRSTSLAPSDSISETESSVTNSSVVSVPWSDFAASDSLSSSDGSWEELMYDEAV
ncbi:hypothetical protein C8F01DRAFT_1190157 [Mycena amicta]|nr:hypothetical protein C8F01DRAFT_1190157 [Mycena amicta]